MLADKRTQRHTGNQRHGEAGKHHRNRTRGFFFFGTSWVAMVGR